MLSHRVIDSLCIGDRVTVGPHVIERIGLWGGSAFRVDGVPCSAAEAVAVDVPAPSPAPAPPPPSRRRRARAEGAVVRAAGAKAAPELLQETRAALRGERGLTFQHRSFAGGEAVTVQLDLGAGAPTAERAISVLCGTGLHAERAPDGAVVVAWTKAVLSGEAAGRGKR